MDMTVAQALQMADRLSGDNVISDSAKAIRTLAAAYRAAVVELDYTLSKGKKEKKLKEVNNALSTTAGKV